MATQSKERDAISTIYSFGYKVGDGPHQFATTGPCAPLIIDCRGIDNPHNDARLRALTGRSVAVQRMVRQSDAYKDLMDQAVKYLNENPEGYVAFGCQYGRHRSVAMAEMLAKRWAFRPMVVHLCNPRERV